MQSAEFGQFVENGDADFGLRLLIFETAGFQFWPDNSLPAPHLCLNSTALIVATARLPGHAAMSLNFNNMSVSK